MANNSMEDTKNLNKQSQQNKNTGMEAASGFDDMNASLQQAKQANEQSTKSVKNQGQINSAVNGDPLQQAKQANAQSAKSISNQGQINNAVSGDPLQQAKQANEQSAKSKDKNSQNKG